MPDTDYTIRYVVEESRALRGLDAIDNRMLKSIALAERYKAVLKSVGSDLTGLATFTKGLQAVEGELKKTVSAANATEKELKDVGKGNSSLGSYATRLEKVIAHLNAAASAGATATASLGGVGAGGPGAGGGRGGAAGGVGPSRLAAGLGRHVAYSAFRKTVGAAGSGAADRRSFFSEAADTSAEFRKDLQELAVLQGKPSADDALVREQLAFGKATGLNAEDAAELRLEFGGAIAPGKARGNINDATAVDLEKEAGRFGARYGLDPRTTGRMAGLLPNYGKVPTAAAGVGTLAASAEYLNVFGLGSVKSMMPSMVGLQADMLDSEEGGRFKDLESLSARFGVTTFAAKSPAMAGTQIRQSNRLLRKAIGQYGITAEDDYETALGKIAPHITGPGGDLALTEAGFHNSTERDSVIKQARMISVVEKATQDPRIAAARANAVRANADFAQSPTGRQQAAENDEFAATIEAGMEGERLKAARTSARARMIDQGRLKPRGIRETLQDSLFSGISSFGGVSGEALQVDAEAVAELRRQGKAVGVDVDRKYPDLDPTRQGSGMKFNTLAGTDEAGFQRQFGQASREVDAARKLRQAGGLLIDAANGMGSQGQGPAMPPPPGNGGAGFNPGRR